MLLSITKASKCRDDFGCHGYCEELWLSTMILGARHASSLSSNRLWHGVVSAASHGEGMQSAIPPITEDSKGPDYEKRIVKSTRASWIEILTLGAL